MYIILYCVCVCMCVKLLSAFMIFLMMCNIVVVATDGLTGVEFGDMGSMRGHNGVQC